ncbi:MAG: class Ib ribonucleoside-diphosphate reductase assembly flavoprotein NrdI [Varibaculum sp.]|nr:class Ib ribonucleoside-diphosphate reductase assembly flavoprotein NrdI [Varibaculum sp.]
MAGKKADEPVVVYFSSATNNTHRFIQKLGFENYRIPLLPKDEPLHIDQPFILVVPTYGGGDLKKAVPKQVIKFLNDPENRKWCRGVISSGNTNFGTHYAVAGDILERKLHVPFLYRYELLGTPQDAQVVTEGLRKFWQTI